jgi:SAM-dependent methyltransferase
MSESPEKRVDYDQVAPTYDQRFAYYAGERAGIARALLDVVRDVGAQRILEVGCGTGRWLGLLRRHGCQVFGLDRSMGMLERARASADPLSLVRGSANALPFRSREFDLVFCVNAVHHFDDAAGFIRDARSLLRPGGALAIVGMDPHAGRDRWYLYDYFPGSYDSDRRRYPSSGTLIDWMIAAGFDTVEGKVAERLVDTRTGRHVLEEPMLQKNATSQLTLLSDAEYAAGLARIRTAIAEAEAVGEERVFTADISLAMVTGRLRETTTQED